VKASSGDNAMKMGVIEEGLCPGVKDQREADPGPEVFGPERDLVKSFRDGSKDQVVGLPAMGRKERVKDVGDREDEMMVFGGQQSNLLSLKPSHLIEAPAFGTVTVAARVVGDLPVSAPITFLDVAAQGCGAALGNGSNNPRLLTGKHRQPIGVLAEDVGEFQLWAVRAALMVRRAMHASALGWREVPRVWKDIKRARGVVEKLLGNVGVDLGRLETRVAEQDLDLPDIHPAFEQVSGKAVPKAMDGDLLGDAGPVPRLVEDPLNGAPGQRTVFQYRRSTSSSFGESMT